MRPAWTRWTWALVAALSCGPLQGGELRLQLGSLTREQVQGDTVLMTRSLREALGERPSFLRQGCGLGNGGPRVDVIAGSVRTDNAGAPGAGLLQVLRGPLTAFVTADDGTSDLFSVEAPTDGGTFEYVGRRDVWWETSTASALASSGELTVGIRARPAAGAPESFDVPVVVDLALQPVCIGH